MIWHGRMSQAARSGLVAGSIPARLTSSAGPCWRRPGDDSAQPPNWPSIRSCLGQSSFAHATSRLGIPGRRERRCRQVRTPGSAEDVCGDVCEDGGAEQAPGLSLDQRARDQRARRVPALRESRLSNRQRSRGVTQSECEKTREQYALKDSMPSKGHGPPNWRPILSILETRYQRGPTPTPTPTPPGPTPIPTLGPSL